MFFIQIVGIKDNGFRINGDMEYLEIMATGIMGLGIMGIWNI